MKPSALFGYGKTTQAIAKRFGATTFYDDKVTKPFKDDSGNHIKPPSEFDPRYSTLEVPSPGMPPSHPLIQSAQHLVGEYDLFAPHMPYSIWITGTNGKTTTTQMTQHLLQDRDSQEGGNIGLPLAAMDEHKAIWILETSSFSLHYTQKATPNLYIVLPITPDHISWHASFEAYEAAKLSPLSRMKEGEVILLPRKYADTPTQGYKICYDTAEDLARFFGFDTAKLRFKGAFLMDALLAMAVDKILFDRIDYAKINAFVIEAHRQEELRDAQGRLWVNDTKATNIDAALEALKVYADHELHLILGGDDKGVALEPLFEGLKGLHVSLYLIGSNEARLARLAKEYGFPFFPCNTLAHAVTAIHPRHTDTSVALLSPAAASLDQFSSYVERGNLFKKFVQDLSKN